MRLEVRRGAKLVLIEDNDRQLRRVLETEMPVRQFRTVTPSDDEQMLALARVEHPQRIITDVAMSGRQVRGDLVSRI